MTRKFDLHDQVSWLSNGEGRVVGLWDEPTASVEFPDGRVVTIGVSKLEKVVPPLPVVKDTVIEPHWKPGIAHTYTRLMLADDGRWWRCGSGSFVRSSAGLMEEITGWRLIAAPVVEAVLAEDEDSYYDSDDMTKARHSGYVAGVHAAVARVRRGRWLNDDTLDDIERSLGGKAEPQ